MASASRALHLSRAVQAGRRTPTVLRPLAASASLLPAVAGASAAPGAGVRCFATQPATSSLRDSSPNFSNRPPKETILLDGCDFEHWLVVMEPPPGDASNPDIIRDEIIQSYVKTLAQVVGSEEEARQKIYSVSTRHYFAFGALVPEELSYKLKEMPKVRWVLPDSYLDVKNKDYGGELFINGQALPYDPKYHEEWVRNAQHAEDRNRRNDRPRNNRSRTFERRENYQNRSNFERRENMQNYQNRDGPSTQGFNGHPPPSGQNQIPPHHGQGNMPRRENMQNYQNRDGPSAQGFNSPPPPPGQNQMPPHHGQGNMSQPLSHAAGGHGGGQPNYQPQMPTPQADYNTGGAPHYQQGGAPCYQGGPPGYQGGNQGYQGNRGPAYQDGNPGYQGGGPPGYPGGNPSPPYQGGNPNTPPNLGGGNSGYPGGGPGYQGQGGNSN